MATIKLTIEYEGTAYAGWQRQPQHLTIQAVLEDALFKVTQQHTPAVGAGRTDSGVHALGQVVSFRSDKSLVGAQWAPALNSYLPEDISVISSEQVEDDFHARFSAKGKMYEYRITSQSSRPALHRHRAWHFPHPLDSDAMQRAMSGFLGTHDFTSFRGQRSQTRNPICTMAHLSLHEESPSFTIRIEGDRFLKQMVRAIVGTLVEVGQHKRSPHTMQDILRAKDRRAAGRTAPPHGLYLVQVLY
ncbi:MAG: tRNA pseudouridine(38-40) synthase TruA [Nitrospirales bacterium]